MAQGIRPRQLHALNSGLQVTVPKLIHVTSCTQPRIPIRPPLSKAAMRHRYQIGAPKHPLQLLKLCLLWRHRLLGR